MPQRGRPGGNSKTGDTSTILTSSQNIEGVTFVKHCKSNPVFRSKEIKQLFNEKVYVRKNDITGQNKGFAFILKIATEKAVEELDGHTFQERILHVKLRAGAEHDAFYAKSHNFADNEVWSESDGSS